MDQVTTESITTSGAIDEGLSIPANPPANGSPYTSEHDNWPYVEYSIDTIYETDEGIRVEPTSQATGSAIKVRVGLPLTTKIILFSIERHGKKPKIPHWSTSNANEVLLTRRIKISNPMPLPDRQVWKVTGKYVYKLLLPLTENDILCAGTTPAEIGTSAQHIYVRGDLDKTLTNAAVATPRLPAPIPRTAG